MKRLAILRHAKSSWDDPGLDDFDRPLNDRGRKSAARMGRELDRRGFRFDLVLASAAERVRGTIAGLTEKLQLDAPVQFDPRLYLAGDELLMTIVRGLPETVEWPLLVGHNPGLQDLLLKLAANDDDALRQRVAHKFPTAAFSIVELPADRWATVESGTGRMVELILPKELD